jgi:hypothetical protein
MQIGNSLPDTYDINVATPSLTSPPIPQIFSDHYLPLNGSEQAKQGPAHSLTQEQRQGTYSISGTASAKPNPTLRHGRDESSCKHEDCRNSALSFRSMSGNKHYDAQHRSETSKIQSARAYSHTSGTEFVGREYRGSQGRMSPETLGSESASQISQPRQNPLGRREDADRLVSNNHSFSDSDGSVGRNQHWGRDVRSVASESVDNVSSAAPGAREYAQQSQTSTQSTQDSCRFGVTYPYEDDFSYL